MDWHPSGAGLASPSYDILLVAAEHEGDTAWQISHHPLVTAPPTWTATFTSGTPAEIVTDTLVHLTTRLQRDRLAAVAGPTDLRSIFDAVERAGWDTVLLGDQVHAESPEPAVESIELWHRVDGSWYSAPDTEPGATTIVAGRAAGPLEARGWQADFSRHTPAHLITATLMAATAPKPATRRAHQIPRPYRDVVFTVPSAGDDKSTPAHADIDTEDPTIAVEPLRDWRHTEDELGNMTLHSPCGRVSVAHTPEHRPDQRWTSPWTITATGDGSPWSSSKEDCISWTARFTTHTPTPVVAAVTVALAEALRRLDVEEVWDDFESSPEPSFTPHRRYRPDPVPGSRDPALAHAQLRLSGWHKSDLPHRDRSSTSPVGVKLWSVLRGEPSSLDIVPLAEAWTLDGGDPPALWSATFSPDTPTFLITAAAREADRLAQSTRTGTAPQHHLAARRAAARSAPATPLPAAQPATAPAAPPPAGPRRTR
ncbi:DUF317 domain-containing protein [Streptomyces sp. CBMA123]|uniref:DUF317 domain-containing protein n=1 Tax=Streptomyces sp. CBMA123 TaxID=1896313 RepID=UPI001661C0F3|nr:DUF317 domain-containing protein [Streptomyces sp. CBMA123]MBD0688274.1 hypothetical protein [Streptomyces sp. CBMA123]